MEAAVVEFHLRLDAGSRRDPPVFDTVGQVTKQCGLADASLAAENYRPAPTGPRVRQQLVESSALL
jgi:hypothetical protein